MGNKVSSVIVASIDGNVSDITSRDVLEYDQGADWDLFTRVKVVSVSTLRETDSTCGTCFYPSVRCRVIGTGRTGITGFRNAAGVNTGDVRQIVVIHIRYVGCAAETTALESGNIRSESGCCTGFGYGFSTVLNEAIRNVRAVSRSSGTIGLEDGSVILLRLDTVTGIGQRIKIDIVQHLTRDVRCRCCEYCRRDHRGDHQHRQEKRQETRAEFLFLGHNFQSFLIFDMKRAPTR